VRGRQSKAKMRRFVSEAETRAVFVKHYSEATGDTKAALKEIGQKRGYVDTKGKIIPERPPPTTTEQFNASIREAALGTTGRLSRVMGQDHGEA
jgi:hypothetical protein